MARETRTNVVVRGESRGMDKLMRKVTGLNQAALDGLKAQAEKYTAVESRISGLQAKIKGLTEEQVDALRAMEGIADQGSEAWKTQQERMDKAKEAARGLTQEVRLLRQLYADEADAAERVAKARKDALDYRKQATKEGLAAFGQGFAQTAMPGPAGLFLQRGQGMGAQMAGQMAGGGFRRGFGVMRGIGHAAFTGLPGMQEALAALPGGGILSGMLGTSAAYAEQALQWQRQKVAMAPMLGGPQQLREIQAAETGLARTREAYPEVKIPMPLQEAAAAVRESYEPSWTEVPKGMIRRLGGAAPGTDRGRAFDRGWDVVTDTFGGPSGPSDAQKAAFLGKTPAPPWPERGESEDERLRREATGEVWERLAPYNEKIMERRGAIGEAQQKLDEARSFGDLRRLGSRLRGLSEQEAAQEASMLLQAGGGRLGGSQAQSILPRAMAANTLFGVDPGLSGKFLQAGRRGGLVGGDGQAGEAFQLALTNAVRLGLVGSEVPQYLQQVAAGIDQFRQTGIPMAEQSLKGIASELSEGGLQMPRALAVGAGIQQHVQGMGARGPTGGLDLMLMQLFGGYTGSGGAREVEQAFIRMEEMQKSGGATPELIKRLVQTGGGGAGGRLFARRQLGKMGVQVGAREMSLLGKRAEGRQLTDDEQAYLDAERGRRKAGEGLAGSLQTPAQLAKAAEAMITRMGPNLRQQAEIQNKQLAVGSRMIGVIKKMEVSATKMTNSFAQLAGEKNSILNRVVNGLGRFADAVERVSGKDNASMWDILSVILGN